MTAGKEGAALDGTPGEYAVKNIPAELAPPGYFVQNRRFDR